MCSGCKPGGTLGLKPQWKQRQHSGARAGGLRARGAGGLAGPGRRGFKKVHRASRGMVVHRISRAKQGQMVPGSSVAQQGTRSMNTGRGTGPYV
jgi:hypothetical protein